MKASLHYLFHTTINYSVWFICLIFAYHNAPWEGTGLAAILLSLQCLWLLYFKQTSKPLLSFTLTITLLSFICDTTLMQLHLIEFTPNPWTPYVSPPWILMIWLCCAVSLFATVRQWFNKTWLLAGLCLIGVPIAYAAGARLGVAHLPYGYVSTLIYGVVWAIVFPTVSWQFRLTDAD